MLGTGSLFAQAPACYPDAPAIITTAASAQAQLVVPPRNGDGFENYADLILYTFTHALVTQSAATASSALALQKLRGIELVAVTSQTSTQVGSGAGAIGTTSLFEKPDFAKLLSFAIEHGGVTKLVDGSTLKLASSPYALIAASQGDTSATYHQYEFFTHIGLSANFRVADQTNVLASARRKQLEHWSVRYLITQDHSARSSTFEQFWKNKIEPKISVKARVITGEAARIFQNNRALEAMRRDKGTAYLEMINKLKSAKATAEVIAGEILCFVHNEIYTNVRNGTIPLSDAERQSLIQEFIPGLTQAQLLETEGRADAEAEISRLQDLPEATLAYTNYRLEHQSDYSDIQFFYQRKTFTPMTLVFNANLALYTSPNEHRSQSTVRGFGTSLSFEGKGGRSPFVTNPQDHSMITYAFSGRYERIRENRYRPGVKADIALAQFRLEIPVQTGVTIPLSFTYANATPLIKEKDVRGNFGLTLDTDKLIALARLVAATR